jgi:hypothetical protein
MDVTTCDTTRLNIIGEKQPAHPLRAGHCPTCGQETHFIFLGEQRWPEKVAAKLGLPAVMLQWSCESCHTTLSEPAPDA